MWAVNCQPWAHYIKKKQDWDNSPLFGHWKFQVYRWMALRSQEVVWSRIQEILRREWCHQPSSHCWLQNWNASAAREGVFPRTTSLTVTRLASFMSCYRIASSCHRRCLLRQHEQRKANCCHGRCKQVEASGMETLLRLVIAKSGNPWHLKGTKTCPVGKSPTESFGSLERFLKVA